MKRRLVLILTLITSGLLIHQPVFALIKVSDFKRPNTLLIQKAGELGKNRFIIEFDTPSFVSFPKQSIPIPFWNDILETRIHRSHQSFFHQMNQRNISYQKVFEFHYLMNGASVICDPIHLKRIEEIPGVKKIYGINQYYLDRTYSIPSIQAQKVWELTDLEGRKLTGEGIIVGIIDTGLDYNHPDLGGGIGLKPDGSYYKVRGGYDFSEMTPISFDPTYSFHGTHVAGIVGGVGEAGSAVGKPIAKGVAPSASLISYKVFTNKAKSTGSDSILYSLEQAFKDGCDVVNLSLGRDYGWTEDPLAAACDRASDAGIIVVASAGNDGRRDNHYNLFPIHTPGTGLSTISVASSDETIKTGFSYSVQGKQKQIIGRMLNHSGNLPYQNKYDVVLVPGSGSEADFNKVNVSGKVALLKRGDLSFQEKNDNAKKAKAVAIIIYNYTPGQFSGTLEKKEENLPVLAIDKIDGEELIQQLEKNSVQILFEQFSQLSTLSNFTSEGPTPDYYLKPDLTAPGSNILSSVPGGAYEYASGTSMAAPHVSGGAAILKQLYPEASVGTIKSLLVNYADLLINPSTQTPYSLFLQGSGKLNLYQSVLGKVVVDPVSITLHEIEKNNCAVEKEFTFMLTNISKEEVFLTLSGEVMDSKNCSIEFVEESFLIKPSESRNIMGKVVLLVDHQLPEGDNQFIITISSDKNPLMHMAGIFHYGERKKMNDILHGFCFPTLAISPNGDGNADSNELYFLSPYLTDGLEVDLYSENEKDHLGVMNYYRGSNGAGYFSTIFDGFLLGRSLEDGFYSAIPYVLPIGKDYKDPSSWVAGKSLKMLIDKVSPTMTLTVQVDLLKEFIHISGTIQDNNSNLGLFCFYEIDYDVVDLVSVGSDGTFKASIPMEEYFMTIKVTAQDLAGNTYSIKKRLY